VENVNEICAKPKMQPSAVRVIHSFNRPLLLALLFFFKGEYIEVCAQEVVDRPEGCVWTVYRFAEGGVASEGCLVRGLPEGMWTAFHPTGAIKSRGNRENHVLAGDWEFYREDGTLEQVVQYAAGKRNGWEAVYAADGTLVSRTPWAEDVRSGVAEFFHPNGSKSREIPFANGREHGTGKEFAEDDGRLISRMVFSNGVQIGLEKINRYGPEGKKEGLWEVVRASGGLQEEGTWRRGVRHGIFRFYDAQGKLERMEKYENGERVVDETTTAMLDIRREFHPNGTVRRIGSYRDGKEHGIFREYDATGALVGGTLYVDGVRTGEGVTDALGNREGPWKLWYPDGSVQAEGVYAGGVREGEWTFYYPNGEVAQRGSYREGAFHGAWVWYYPGGKIHRKEQYRNGKEDGQILEYSPEGQILVEGEYVRGLRNGAWTVDVNDHREQGAYIDGEKTGEWIHTHASGTVIFRGSYVNGMPEGRHTWWYADGTRRMTGMYVGGVQEGRWVYSLPTGEVRREEEYKGGELRRIDGLRLEKIEPSDAPSN
jgi:antitoxin component YwqK of YwqJK toxin-antitoxin module